MKRTLRRVAAVLCSVPLVAGLVVFAASPAQASASDCTSYLERAGYSVGPKVTDVCTKTARPRGYTVHQCTQNFIAGGISANHALSACNRAKL